MIEILFYVIAVLVPLLLPVALVVWAIQRPVKRKVTEHHEALEALRMSIDSVEKGLNTLTQDVRILRSATEEGAVAPISEEAEKEAAPAARRVPRPPELRPERPPERPVAPTPTELPPEAPPPEIPHEWPIRRRPEEVPPGPPPVPEPARVVPTEEEFRAVERRAREMRAEEVRTVVSAWEALTRRFLENWTGVLGSVVLVAGIGFLGTYAALRVSPAMRFLMVLAAAIALFSAYYPLHRHKRWQPMALWLRSSGAAVFLFACAGAGGLPNLGLMWITTPTLALLVLMVGVAANLALAWIVGREAFASLHVVLSLIPMAILPQLPLALVIATAITAIGVVLAYRHPWDKHLSVSILGYAIFHVWWVSRQAGGLPLEGSLPLLACASAAIVFVLGALIPYRRETAPGTVPELVIVNHLACWGLLAAAILTHLVGVDALGGSLAGIALIAAATVAYLASSRDRGREVPWLGTADLLTAQGLVLAALFSWKGVIGEPELLVGLVFLETLLFLRVVIGRDGDLAGQVGVYLSHAAGLAFALIGLAAAAEALEMREAWRLSALMFGGACAAVLSVGFLRRYHADRVAEFGCYGSFDPTGRLGLGLYGILAGILATVALVPLLEAPLFGVTALTLGAALIYGSRQIRGAGLGIGAWLLLTAAHVLSWSVAHDYPAGLQLAQLVPVAGLAALAIRLAPTGHRQLVYRHIAIYLLGAHIGISAYLLLKPVSLLAPTVAWLLLSLAALEIATRLDREYGPTVLRIGYGFVAAFAAGYFLVVLPTQSYLGPIRARLAIEIFGLASLAYWWLARPPDRLAECATWRAVHPYFFELGLVLLAFTVFAEVPLAWRPIAWVAAAVVLLSRPMRRLASRSLFYSLAAFFTSVIALSVNVSITATPSPHWYDQPGTVGLLAIAAQVAYLLWSWPRLHLGEVEFQSGLGRLQRLCGDIEARRAAVIFYPFFAGLALFLYWRFDRALLTFLWSAEAFTIFVLSIVLRQGHFRLVALAGLAACLLRLVVYDLAQADLFFRGLVFIGVGGLMLAMNAVYNKYRSRIELG